MKSSGFFIYSPAILNFANLFLNAAVIITNGLTHRHSLSNGLERWEGKMVIEWDRVQVTVYNQILFPIVKLALVILT
jgi:hypothetical protein